MQLFLLRHSIAEATVTTDFERRLTPKGIAKASRLAKHLDTLNVAPSVILHSPLVRSQQTAQIIAKGASLPLIELPEVIDAGDSLLAVIAAGGWKAPMVIGHNPGISVLASRLAGTEGPLGFRTCSFAAFELDAMPPKSSRLVHWITTPPACDHP